MESLTLQLEEAAQVFSPFCTLIAKPRLHLQLRPGGERD